jgi:2,3-bisphosphoglycerate-dependent phosphoglycerate mutase
MVVVMRLWLVRHGDTTWSEQGRLCGWADVPLSNSGLDQARDLRARLDARRFDGVWTSDLARAREFARLVFDGAVPDYRLREIDFGALEGRTFEECDPDTQHALIAFDGFAAPGGESVQLLETRLRSFLFDLVPGDHLVFTHGGVIRLLHRLRGLSHSPASGELVILDWPTSGRDHVSSAKDAT